jgi:hypothetical protein
MSKLFCIYDKENPVEATRQCDECGALLCNSCGYSTKVADYCNKCADIYFSPRLGKRREVPKVKHLITSCNDKCNLDYCPCDCHKLKGVRGEEIK